MISWGFSFIGIRQLDSELQEFSFGAVREARVRAETARLTRLRPG